LVLRLREEATVLANPGLSGEVVMPEWWSTRWYTPLVLLGAGLMSLLGVALAGVEVLTAAVPRSVTPRIWTPPLAQVDRALTEGDRAAALSWWRDANAAAIRSGQWEGMIEVGDSARRLEAGAVLARQAYLTALFRARQQRSLDGLLRAAAAFGELGDHEVLEHALRIAEREAGLDPRANARVTNIADRWTRIPLTTERRDPRHPGGQLP
jgi:hypothetical protein